MFTCSIYSCVYLFNIFMFTCSVYSCLPVQYIHVCLFSIFICLPVQYIHVYLFNIFICLLTCSTYSCVYLFNIFMRLPVQYIHIFTCSNFGPSSLQTLVCDTPNARLLLFVRSLVSISNTSLVTWLTLSHL